MTITIDGVDTVIRKDNCKVQAFGDVVRITDYKGSIYEFLYRDCTAPDEPTANDLRDAIEDFLNTGGGGGGGGITTLTSTDGSISIDLTDPSAPDLSVGYLSYVALLTQTGTSAPTVTVLQNTTGLTWTASYDDVGVFFLTPDTEPDEDKIAVFSVNAAATGSVNAFYRNGVINISTKDGIGSQNSVLSRSAIEIRIYP